MKTNEIVENIATVDMSPIGLIMNADIIVKLVILLLIISSVISWSIIFNKLIRFKSLKIICDKFEQLFWSSPKFEQLYERIKGRVDHPLANIFIAGINELNLSSKSRDTNGSLTRINQSMEIAKLKEISHLEKNISILAIIASNAPFVGLFGTVWGIMHSFGSIASSNNTSLAVVAPGIAEALLATAIGLVVAIPAAIFYNILTEKLNKFWR